jgi:hypothetical protein
MSRWMLIALLGLSMFSAVGCDDDDVEIDTPGGKVKIDK